MAKSNQDVVKDEFNYPKEVLEAAELAEKVHASLFAQPEPEPEPTPEPQPNPEPDDSDTPQLPKDDDEETYKRRYETLQGKYNAEVPRLAKELREFKETYVNNQLALLQAQNQKQEVVKDEPNPVLEAFKEEYGEDLFNQIRTLIQLETKSTFQEVAKPFEEKTKTIEELQETLARQNLETYLDTHSKGWREAYYSDPKFEEFLTKPDPSGLYTYGELFEAYNNKWDQEKISKIFNIYLGENKPVTPPPVPPKVNNREALVAPSRTNANPTPPTDNQIIWTQSEIEKFQRDDRAGKYTPEESQLIWNDLLAALSENRIK